MKEADFFFFFFMFGDSVVFVKDSILCDRPTKRKRKCRRHKNLPEAKKERQSLGRQRRESFGGGGAEIPRSGNQLTISGI